MSAQVERGGYGLPGHGLELCTTTRYWHDRCAEEIRGFVSGPEFPSLAQFRLGILLGNIAQGISMSTHSGWFPHDPEWNGSTYLDDNTEGERWAVTFGPAGAIAVFYTTESDRNPYPADSEPYDRQRFFDGMPANLAPLRRDAHSEMFDIDSNLGTENGVVTAAMWCSGERFTAAESWQAVYEHGAFAAGRHFETPDRVIARWAADLDLSDTQQSVVRSIFDRKMEALDEVLLLEPWERDAIIATSDDRGLTACREWFETIGIKLA